LAYAIRSDMSVYQDTGIFSVQAGVDKNKVYEATKIILEELSKIKKFGVNKEELSRVKTFFAGKLSLDLEDSASVASWYGQQELLVKKILTPEEKVKIISKVDGAQISSVARDVFKSNNLCAAAIGQSINRSKLLSILKAGL
jgi:predicted Zn-dependent peptidase